LLVVEIPEVSVITRLHPEDIRAIAAAVAAELRSGGNSPMGVAAPGERFPWSDGQDRGSMDPMNTETSSESTLLQAAEAEGRRVIMRLQRGLSPKPSSTGRRTRRRERL
jgi:hypothetical protein